MLALFIADTGFQFRENSAFGRDAKGISKRYHLLLAIYVVHLHSLGIVTVNNYHVARFLLQGIAENLIAVVIGVHSAFRAVFCRNTVIIWICFGQIECFKTVQSKSPTYICMCICAV